MRDILGKIKDLTSRFTLPTAGAYGVLEYLLNNGEATRGFVQQNLSHNPLAALYQIGLWSLAALVEHSGLRTGGLWENNRKGYVRQLVHTTKWLVLEDISYWATQAAVTQRNPFPADNWWGRVFGPVGNLVGTPTPVLQVPIGYLIAATMFGGYLYWELRNRKVKL